MFILSNKIKNQSSMRPVENSPLSNGKKIKQFRPLYDA